MRKISQAENIPPKKNKLGIVAGLLVLAICIGVLTFTVVSAQLVANRVQEVIGLLNTLNNASDTDKQIVLEALKEKTSGYIGQQALGAVSDYCSGDDALSTTCNNAMHTLLLSPVGGNGSFISTVTTTPATATYFSINEALDLTGTSTAKGATQNVVSYWTNTGADKILTFLALDLSTALGSYTASFQCGTSTWVGGVEGVSLEGTTTAAVIASSTVASTYDTGDLWNLHGTHDFSTSTALLIKTGEVVFCTRTIGGTMTGTATSADSFTSTGGATGVGRMLGEIRARGN